MNKKIKYHISFCLIFILLFSCKSKDCILLIKETQIVDVNVATTIMTFPWHNDFEGQKDSILIKNPNHVYDIIYKLEQNGDYRHDIWNPRYAFVLKYNNTKDTLYYDENFHEGFLVENNIRLIDTTGILKQQLLKKYKNFLEKEYN